MQTADKIKDALSFITQMLSEDVLPFFELSTHQYDVNDMSAITSKFLLLQQSIVDLHTSVNSELEDNITEIENLMSSSSAGQSPLITGSHKNLKISTTGLDSSVTASFDELVLKSLSNTTIMVRDFNGTFSTLDTGELAINTWYAVYIINDGINTIGILSSSFVSPALPVGYTHFARIGSVRTDGTNKYFLPINQVGNKVIYRVQSGTNLTSMRLMASGTLGNVSTPVWVPVNTAQFIPPSAPIIHLIFQSPNNGAQIMAPNNAYGGFSSATNPPPFFGNVSYGRINEKMQLLSENLYVACSVASNLFCYGWEDNI